MKLTKKNLVNVMPEHTPNLQLILMDTAGTVTSDNKVVLFTPYKEGENPTPFGIPMSVVETLQKCCEGDIEYKDGMFINNTAKREVRLQAESIETKLVNWTSVLPEDSPTETFPITVAHLKTLLCTLEESGTEWVDMHIHKDALLLEGNDGTIGIIYKAVKS